jgi:hypothetical protein
LKLQNKRGKKINYKYMTINKAASELGKQSYKKKLEKYGVEGYKELMSRAGKKGGWKKGRPRKIKEEGK